MHSVVVVLEGPRGGPRALHPELLGPFPPVDLGRCQPLLSVPELCHL